MTEPGLSWLGAATLRVFELGQIHEPDMPVSPNHPDFMSALIRRHGDVVRPDGGSAANDLLVLGSHNGTHLDGLAHVSQDGVLYGGLIATDLQGPRGFADLGMETVTPIVCRALLLDVAAAHGVDVLPPGYEVTVEDLEAASEAAGGSPEHGDAVLIRTGWSRHWGSPEVFLGQEAGAPGPGESAAHWLAARTPRLVGGETVALEVIPPGAGHRVLPVHRVLIVERGIHILEMMNLAALAEARISQALFVCLPLRLRGATGSPVRPVALAP